MVDALVIRDARAYLVVVVIFPLPPTRPLGSGEPVLPPNQRHVVLPVLAACVGAITHLFAPACALPIVAYTVRSSLI